MELEGAASGSVKLEGTASGSVKLEGAASGSVKLVKGMKCISYPEVSQV
jgi:hypothetical protein